MLFQRKLHNHLISELRFSSGLFVIWILFQYITEIISINHWLMGLSQQIIDCQCKGYNPNCSVCDGKGYYYKTSDDESKKIKKTESDGHVLDFDAMGIPKDVNITIPEYEPDLTKRKRNPKHHQQKPSIPDASFIGTPKLGGSKNDDIKPPKPKSSSMANSSELVRSFPELREFFKHNQPTPGNLERLLVDLSSIYKDKKIHSSATAFIKLEIFKLKLEEESATGTGGKSQQKNSKKINKQNDPSNPDIPHEIPIISKMLNIPERSFIRFLEQKSIFKKEGDMLNESEMRLIKPYVSARLKALKRQNKRRLW